MWYMNCIMGILEVFLLIYDMVEELLLCMIILLFIKYLFYLYIDKKIVINFLILIWVMV